MKSTWTLMKRNKSKIQAMDIKYLRRIVGKVRWNRTRLEVLEKLEWSGHVNGGNKDTRKDVVLQFLRNVDDAQGGLARY
jgi:hypothetical protein